MTNAQRYMSKAEKKAAFKEIGDIEHRSQIDQLFDLLANEDRRSGYFYRGIKRASYKLLTTGQRYWMDNPQAHKRFNDDYHTMFVNRLHALRTRDDLPFKELFNRWSIDAGDDLAMLSLLQHYGGSTPFLDLTEDPFVALQFSIEEPGKRLKPASELDAYFAFYTFPRDLTSAFNQAFKDAITKMRAERPDVKAEKVYSDYRFFSEGYFLIMHHKWVEEHLDKDHGKLMNNPFIIQQRGLFAFNSTADLPIPEALREFEKEFHDPKAPGIWPSEQLKCVNINRKLAPYVQEKLSQLNPPMSADHIKPDFKKIFERVWEEVKEA